MGGDHGHSSGPYCEDKKEKQCHKHPRENTRKIPKQTCKKIVDTIFIEECEERIHTVCEKLMREVTTALVLLIIIQRLLLPPITQDIMRLMEVIITRIYFDEIFIIDC